MVKLLQYCTGCRSVILMMIIIIISYANCQNHPSGDLVKEVVHYSCDGIVCTYSRLYKKDKTYIIDRMNQFRNTVAGGNYKTYPYCLTNVNKLVWNNTLATIAQKQVNTCPRAVWHNKTISENKIPKPTKNYAAEFTKNLELDNALTIDGRSCDRTTLIVFGGIDQNDLSKSYKVAKYDTFNYINRGQLEDFWNKELQNGMFDIIFRRAESTEVGCGYMLRFINQTFAGQELLSYLRCIYCTFDLKKPLIKSAPCTGCSASDANEMYPYLCRSDKNEYSDIPNDIPGLSITCVHGKPSNETVMLIKESYTSTRSICPTQAMCPENCEQQEQLFRKTTLKKHSRNGHHGKIIMVNQNLTAATNQATTKSSATAMKQTTATHLATAMKQTTATHLATAVKKFSATHLATAMKQTTATHLATAMKQTTATHLATAVKKFSATHLATAMKQTATNLAETMDQITTPSLVIAVNQNTSSAEEMDETTTSSLVIAVNQNTSSAEEMDEITTSSLVIAVNQNTSSAEEMDETTTSSLVIAVNQTATNLAGAMNETIVNLGEAMDETTAMSLTIEINQTTKEV